MNEQEVVGFANEGFANEDAAALDVLASLSARYVEVIHGAHNGQHPVADQTVAAIRSTFAGPYNIPSDAIARINGNQVGDDYVLRPNEQLEFVKLEGIKG